MKATKLNRYRE